MNISNNPRVRFFSKLFIDVLIALFIFLCTNLLLPDVSRPSLALLLGPWVCIVTGVNLLFQLPRQHYRFIGKRATLRIAYATGTIAVLSALAIHFDGQTLTRKGMS